MSPTKTDVATVDSGTLTRTLRGLVQRPESAEPSPIPADVLARVADLVQGAPLLSGNLGDMLNRIMDCETIDEAATIFSGLDSTEDYVGVKLLIESFALNESDYDNPASLPFYALVTAKDMAGNEVMFNTGSTSILVTLLTAYRRNWFPFTAHFEEVPLPGGNRAFNMVFDD